MDWGAVPAWVAAVIAAVGVVVAIRAGRGAQERPARLAEALVVAAQQRSPWRLEHRAGDTYWLRNAGLVELHGVQVAGDVIVRLQPARSVAAGEAVQFWALHDMDTQDEMVTVTWHRRPDCSDEALSWRQDLPPRPKR